MSSGQMDKEVMAEIDPYPISALQDRYGLNSRQAVYDRINKLGIQPARRGKISSNQLDILDRLDNWIKGGRTIENFISSELREAISSEFASSIVLPTLSRDEKYSLRQGDDFTSLSVQLVREIAALVHPQANPLQHLECLERAADKGWLLSTSEVKRFIGVKPHGPTFSRGSFTFIRTGKIGREVGWKVKKVTY